MIQDIIYTIWLAFVLQFDVIDGIICCFLYGKGDLENVLSTEYAFNGDYIQVAGDGMFWLLVGIAFDISIIGALVRINAYLSGYMQKDCSANKPLDAEL